MRGRRRPPLLIALSVLLLVASLPTNVLAFDQIDGVDVELPRGASISGTITDPGGDPVVGAFVEACAADFCGDGAATAADGTYEIRGLIPDAYTVHVIPPDGPSDVLDAWYTSTGPVDAQEDADVIDASSGDVTGIDLQLLAGHRISGTVSITGVGTRAGIQVAAYGPSDDIAITAANGTFTLRGLRDGDYTLDVLVPDTLDGLSGPVVGGAVGDQEDEGTIVTVSGGNVTGQAITTARGRRMSGRLTGTGGTGGAVYVASDQMERSAVIEPDGDWVVRGLRPGAYGLVFQRSQSDDGFESLFPFGYWDGAGALTTDDGAATTITVAATDVTGRDASVPSAPTLSGTVKAIDGTPLAGAYVYACADPVGCASDLTASDGSWAFAGARAGSYRIQAWHQEHPGGRYGVGGYSEDEGHAAAVTVGSASGGPVAIVLPDGGSISGTVSRPMGAPAAAIDVMATDGSGIPPVPPGHDTTATDGSYRLDGLLPGLVVDPTAATRRVGPPRRVQRRGGGRRVHR